MEERAVSPEQGEEVIELLDIVQPAEAEDGIIELAAEDIASFGDAVGEAVGDACPGQEEELLELVDVVEQGQVVEQGGDAPAEPAFVEEMAPEAAPVAEARPAFLEEASFERYASEVDARFSVIEELWQVESQSSQEHFAALRSGLDDQAKVAEARFAALQQACSAEVQTLREELASAASTRGEAAAEAEAVAQRLASLEERVTALGESHGAGVQALQAGLAAAEERLAVLSEENAELKKGLAECPSAFLSDSSVRLALEEMVGRMVEARLLELSQAKEQEADAADEAAEAVAESVEALGGQVKDLHERMEKWEERCEQEAALAAARIIREEIAAMRAGAARMQH